MLAEDLREAAEGKGPEEPLLHVPSPWSVSSNFRRDCAKARIIRGKKEGKATFHSLRVNYINSVVESGSDLKTIMTLARHGSAQMSMEVYAKAKTEHLRDAAEAASERLERAISAESCHTCVKQAVGAETEVPTDEGLEVFSAQNSLVAPRGFGLISPPDQLVFCASYEGGVLLDIAS